MHNDRSWCFSLGRWGGLHLRLHVSFLLFAAVALLVDSAGGGIHRIAPLALLILLASVIVHVLGHYQATRHLGVKMAEALLAPWGEFANQDTDDDDPAMMLAHLAGPVANFIVCLICVPILLFQDVNLIAFFHPLAPDLEVTGFTWAAAVKLTFRINALMIFVNLLPVFPFDGGKALRVALSQRWGAKQAHRSIRRMSRLAAIVLMVLAFLTRDQAATSLVPLWFTLTMLALLMFFGTPAEQPSHPDIPANDDSVFGYDFSEGYTSLERSSRQLGEYDEEEEGDTANFLQSRAERRGHQQKHAEIQEELQVDAILARVHKQGLDCLSEDERQLLERVSARYRNRSSDQT